MLVLIIGDDMRNYKNLFFILIFILLIFLGIQILEPTFGEMLTSILTTFTTIIGFISVFFEMKRAADIDECNFILETYKHFTANPDSAITKIHDKLDELFVTGKNTLNKSDRKDIVQYLEFFEMLANLIEKDGISIADIDNLYGYDFFIAANCEFIQKEELIPSKSYYEGIFKIYSYWKKYRESKNKPIPFNETPLL